MGAKKDLTEFVRGQVTGLHQSGQSQRNISKKLKISRKAIQDILCGKTSKRSNCGRRSRITKRDRHVLKRMITLEPMASSTKLSQRLRQHNVVVSARMVREILVSDFKLKARRPAKNPFLTEQQRKKRVLFCKKYQHKSAEWWERVMFTDECTIQQKAAGGGSFVIK